MANASVFRISIALSFVMGCTLQTDDGESDDWDESPSSVTQTLGRVFHVDAAVTRSGSGASETDAFKTISECARIVQAGDRCLVAPGTYRETVRVTAKGTETAPISFRPRPGTTGRVVISGADVVTPGANGFSGWTTMTLNGATVHRIVLPEAWGVDGLNPNLQLDGKELVEAQWPNVPSIYGIRRSQFAISTDGALVSSDGPKHASRYDHPDLRPWMNGAEMVFTPGQEWTPKIGTVTAAQAGRIEFWFHQPPDSNPYFWYAPAVDDPFILRGKREFLDAEGEWHLDKTGVYGTARALTVRFAGGRPVGRLEVQRRNLALQLDGSYIDIAGFDVVNGAVRTSPQSVGIKLANFNALFSPRGAGAAISLAGTRHELRRIRLENTYNDAVIIAGSGHLVADVSSTRSFLGGRLGSMADACSGCRFIHNSVAEVPGHGILLKGLKASEVANNHVRLAGLWITDIAGINAFQSGDGLGTRVHHNLVHDVIAYNGRAKHNGGMGIRVDSGGGDGNSNMTFDHNVVYNVTASAYAVWGLFPHQTNYGNTKLRFVNNTGIGKLGLANSNGGGQRGTVFANNIIVGGSPQFGMNPAREVEPPAGARFEGNIVTRTWFRGNSTAEPAFVDPSAWDFRLASGSPAIDLGVPLPPLTDGFVGTRPDAGALERGTPMFRVGPRAQPPRVAGF